MRVALLAFCYSFWAAAVSGAAVAANPRRRAKARREGARAHSYASRVAADVPWAGCSGHTMAIRGAHELALGGLPSRPGFRICSFGQQACTHARAHHQGCVVSEVTRAAASAVRQF
jgi:hypothetical protein